MLTPWQWVPVVGGLITLVIMLGVVLLLRGGDEEVKSATDCPSDCTLRQEVHWHADFALYLRAERFDFNDEQFLSKDAGLPLSKNVHIHEPRYDVVHVHREQTTWHEFFVSLGFELTDTCIRAPGTELLCSSTTERLTFYVNGVQVDSILFQEDSNKELY